ncbi:hypothetical protein D033_4871A, partial [Vibrio parahaemolyticus B-265]
MYTVK